VLSDSIKSEKVTLGNLLQEAYDNRWEEGLLLKINDGIDAINMSANHAVNDVVNLRHTIKNSRYGDMFRFEIYNGWIKKQISDPLQAVLRLLEKNKEILSETEKEIEIQKEKTEKKEFRATLDLQLKRIHMQKRDIERFIPMLQTSLEKLQS